LLFVAGRCLVPMDETDLFYNLRLGEIILSTRSVPRTNLLSYTNPTFPDPNLAWVFQIFLALAHRAGGIPGAVVLKTAFVVATFALLFRAAVRRGAHPVAAALALALAAWAAEPRFVERPHLVTFLGLAYLLAALARAETGAPRWLYALVPLGVVWANGNSCFFLAPAVLILYAAGARADGRGADARRAAGVAACLVPLAFATPCRTGVIGYVANHFRMPSVRPLQEYRVAEWPLDGPFFFLVAGVALTALIAAALAGFSQPRRTPPWKVCEWRHLLPIAALTLLGARRIRFVAELALLAGPALAVQTTGLATRLGRGRAVPPAWARTGSALGLGSLVLLALGPRVAAWRAGDAVLDLGVEADLVPTATVDWLEARGLRDRLYNDLEVGSYLTWRGWPRYPVFQDPRINAYPPEWHAFFRRTDLDAASWDELLGRFGVRAALISFPTVNPRATLFDPGRWALIHRARDALVFAARRDPRNAPVIAAHEIPLVFRLDARDGSVIEVPIEEQPAGSILAPCQWQQRLGDAWNEKHEPARAEQAYLAALAARDADPSRCPLDPTELRVRAAGLALQLDQAARAAALLEGLSRPDARLDRGFALLSLGRAPEALAELAAARAALPDDPRAAFGVGISAARVGQADRAADALQELLRRWPAHFSAPEARRLLDRLTRAHPSSEAPKPLPRRGLEE
jgi:tetratricopeptide (TPR) repeat protein